LETPIPPFVAPFAVRGFVADVSVFAEGELSCWGHPPGENVPVVGPAGVGVVARFLGVVGWV